MGERTHEIPACEKLEIIRLVEQSHLSVRRTLDKIGIPRKGVYQQDYADLTPYRALASGRDITLLFNHHERKQEAADAFDRISGSAGVFGVVDFALVLSRPRSSRLGQISITGHHRWW